MNEHASGTIGKNDLNKNLIKRFNFHSTMILKSTLGSDTNNDTSTSNRMETDDIVEDIDDENIAKKVTIIRRKSLVLLFDCLV